MEQPPREDTGVHDTTGVGAGTGAGAGAESFMPQGMRVATAWSWRLLVIAAAIAVFVFLIVELRELVVPVMIAVLVSALLVPFKSWLTARGWPRWLAIVVTMLGVLIVVGILFFVAVWQIRSEAHELQQRSVEAFRQFVAWLQSPPIALTHQQIDQYVDQGFKALQNDSKGLLSGALSIGTSIGHIGEGLLLAFFTTIFVLIDGKGIWGWLVRVFPRRARAAVDGAGKAGWATLTSFARVQVLVAAVDAVGIGLVAFFVGLPLVVPIAVLVFLGAFIPIVGAIVTGALAVVVALVYNGWVAALIMLAGLLAVHQLESHVLQPLLMGAAVKVHPLAVVLVVVGGSMLAGIPGALFAVPLAAVLNVIVHYVASGQWRDTDAAPPSSSTGGIWAMVPRSLPGRRNAMAPVVPVPRQGNEGEHPDAEGGMGRTLE
jgi:predicted PurR-regulated permease PerM